ncbi:Uncharacterized protein YjbI, contains pentapeptide repeats [Bauldia litoralis]|uniref:Uncharacterized protein YjbI, contains pentapeptide repeats n=1 Tax=Bauldia litoralis TaxID=665467 RepID=A0A1G6B2N6_9HYPH|nr:Uncharacterized protein YjbI, contains pentapeptide repeats [Bauldia litoralis]
MKDRVKYVDEIAKNTQVAWLTSLALIAFSLITIGGVRDSDFFAKVVRTELPLLGISVPTVAFFIVMPILLASGYLYFLFYVVKLTSGIASLPSEIRMDGTEKTTPLSMAIQPGLISEALISRKTDAIPSEFGFVYPILALFLAWWAAPAVLFLFWIRSWSHHNLGLTIFIAGLLVFALLFGWITYASVLRALRSGSTLQLKRSGVPIIWSFALLAVLAFFTSFAFTRGFTVGPSLLWQADLYQVELVERPDDWLPRRQAELEFLADHANLSRMDLDKALADEPSLRFANAKEQFVEQRNHFLLSLARPQLERTDLRSADMRYGFLPAVNLRRADLSGARLFAAEMEGALLSRAKLKGAALTRTTLSCARLEKSRLDYAYMVRARLDRASLKGAVLVGTNLRGADLSGANLTGATISRTNLYEANLRNAILSEKGLEGAIGNADTILPPHDPPFRLATCFIDLERDQISELSSAWRLPVEAFVGRYVCTDDKPTYVFGPNADGTATSSNSGRCWPNVGGEETD